jgi:hypothetical protein
MEGVELLLDTVSQRKYHIVFYLILSPDDLIAENSMSGLAVDSALLLQWRLFNRQPQPPIVGILPIWEGIIPVVTASLLNNVSLS